MTTKTASALEREENVPAEIPLPFELGGSSPSDTDIATPGPHDQPVLSIRASVPETEAATFIADALHDVRVYMQEHHVQPAGPPFSICRARETQVDVEAGWPTAAPLAGTGRIHGGALPRSLLEPETGRSMS
jgi:hypothetical protein